MSLDFSKIGVAGEPYQLAWNSRDAMLYALGVGAGADDATEELEYTTENSEGIAQQVLPTFGALLSQSVKPPTLGNFDPALVVHADQQFELHDPIPVSGSVHATATVVEVHDKGSGALARREIVAVDDATGRVLVTARSGVFIKGEGGFGRSPSDDPSWELPVREMDLRVQQPVRPEQALVYRLSGDRNPLHSDPSVAGRGGFPRPILHGLCTYGFACRALLRLIPRSDRPPLVSMYGRFTHPVFPGDTLVTTIWRDGAQSALFRTTTASGTVVLDRGTFSWRTADAAEGER